MKKLAKTSQVAVVGQHKLATRQVFLANGRDQEKGVQTRGSHIGNMWPPTHAS